MRLRLVGPYLLPSAVFLVILISSAWFSRGALYDLYIEKPAILPAAVVFCAALMAWLGSLLSLEGGAQRRFWLRRTARVASLEILKPLSLWQRLTRRLPDPIEWLARPLLRTRVGRALAEEWTDAGFGDKPSRYLILLLSSALAGGLLGSRLGGSVLAIALAGLAPVLPQRIVRGRAEAQRRLFGEQLPQALDVLASGLAAGLSFQQAVVYAEQELPQPVSHAFTRLRRRTSLGRPVEEAMRSLLDERPEEALALVVDGIILQRQFGGDMVRMLAEIGELLRQRIELEREVRAVTTQGRFSGVVIAALLPVSAGILLAFNPRYIDVLFDTLIGQVLLVIALILQLIGWTIISRLVRIRH
ncbi:MAG: hypothetical protein GTO14_18850 [Anaerolineales bacterium]|nr:hypothetical protein [Anaerolineales bacterium]